MITPPYLRLTSSRFKLSNPRAQPMLQRRFQLCFIAVEAFNRITCVVQRDRVTRQLFTVFVARHEIDQVTFRTWMRLLRERVIDAGQRAAKGRRRFPGGLYRAAVTALFNEIEFRLE